MKSIQSKNSIAGDSNHSPFFQKEIYLSFFNSKNSIFSAPLIQTKLTANDSNDKYEQEADGKADKEVQRLSIPETLAKKDTGVQIKPLATGITPWIQTKCAACGKEEKPQYYE